MAKVFFTDDDDPIDIRYDNVFKAVFTRPSSTSRGALSRLVSAFIGRDVFIESIAANEPPIDNLRDRQIRFDINCRSASGEMVNVEMSLNPAPYEPIRIEYYAGMLFTGQDIKGTEYDYDSLKQAYQITILAKGYFFRDEEFYHTFEFYDPINHVSLDGKSRIITIELSKLDKIVEKPADTMTSRENWAVFLGYLTDKGKRNKINEIVKNEEGVAMASEVLQIIGKDWEERCRLVSELKYELDLQSYKAYARKQGLKEGREEGREEGEASKALAIAKKMVEAGYSLETVVSMTSLEPEKVQELFN